MIKKRLIGVITVRDGWAVQSIGYRRYLPLGRPEVLAANLDRWGADEILIQCIDRSAKGLGPDFAMLSRISALGLSTPLIYAGGIRTADEAVRAIKLGADRIAVDTLLHDDPDAVASIAEPLGAQAVIAALPVSMQGKSGQGDTLTWYDHVARSEQPLPDSVLDVLRSGAVSEALVIDWRNEGRPGGFDLRIADAFPGVLPLIVFGGLSAVEPVHDLLGRPGIAAVAIGNFLNYREHAVQAYRQMLRDLPIRPPLYQTMLDI